MKKYLYILILFSTLLNAQNDNGKISGRVSDAVTNEGIPFATVVLTGTGIGTATDVEGRYEIPGLAPNTYQLRVSAIGFAAQIKTDIVVTNSKPALADFALQQEVLQLSGVTVTSGFFSQSVNQFSSLNSFGYEEIRRAPGGFEDVVRALSILPGVAQADAGRNDLIVRGGAPSENLYLVDGIEVPSINHFGNQGASGGPLSFINLDFVKETSFSTGGFPVMYGDKLSSVLKIDLRDARTDRFGGKATISASQFGLNLEGPLSKDMGLIFSARRSYLDFIFKAAGFGFVPEYYDFLTKFDYKIDNHNTLSFINITALDNIRYFNTTSDQRLDNSRVLGSEQLQYFSGLVYKHIMPKGLLKVILSRNMVDFDTVQRDTLLNPVFLNKSLEGENKIKVDYVSRMGSHSEFNVGADAKYIKFTADVKIPSFFTTFGEKLPVNALNVKDFFLKYSLYSNVSTHLFDKLALSTGARLDYFDGINNRFTLNPRFAVSYSVNEITSLSFSAGMYSQMPSYIWLAYGNQDLKPIQMQQYILGSEYYLRSDALLKAEIYFKRYNDYPSSSLRPYITLANTGAGFGGSEDNFASFGLEPLISAGTGNTQGVEFSLQKKLSDIPAYGLISLTLNRTEFTAPDGITRPGTYDQRFIFNISGGYQFTESIEASMKFRYASGRPYTPYNADGSQSVVNYNGLRLPSLHSLDLRLDKRWFFANTTLITYLDVQNVYNNASVTYRWNPRTKKVDEDSSIGILPSIGISLEF